MALKQHLIEDASAELSAGPLRTCAINISCHSTAVPFVHKNIMEARSLTPYILLYNV